MKKATLNFIIDGLMLFCMAAVTGIGFLIKYTLISGQNRWLVYGENVELYILGMDRHEWGTIHLVVGFILIGLIVLHVILHWKFITCVFNRIFEGTMMRKLITLLVIAVCALLLFLPFVIKPEVIKIEKGHGRRSTIDNIETNKNREKENTYKRRNLKNNQKNRGRRR